MYTIKILYYQQYFKNYIVRVVQIIHEEENCISQTK